MIPRIDDEAISGLFSAALIYTALICIAIIVFGDTFMRGMGILALISDGLAMWLHWRDSDG